MSDFESKWERVPNGHPDQCKAVISTTGPCRNKAVEGSDYCPAHGGNKAFESNKRRSLRNYRLTKFKQRVEELGNSDQILNLRDEIGVLRLLLEEKWNQCNNDNELLMMSGPLADLVMKIDKVTQSCSRLEQRLGNHLDRSKIVQFAQIIVQIISRYISDEEILENISDEISTSLEEL